MSITLLVELTCVKHPRYRGLRPPAARCDTCDAIYKARTDPREFGNFVFGTKDTQVEIEVQDGNHYLREGNGRSRRHAHS